MTKRRWLVLLMALVAISAVSVAQAEAPTPSADCAKERFLRALAPAVEPVGDAEPLFLAAPGKGRKSSTMSRASSASFSNDCWQIFCSDGTSAECCGSEDTCHWVCETYCGEPCTVIIIWT